MNETVEERRLSKTSLFLALKKQLTNRDVHNKDVEIANFKVHLDDESAMDESRISFSLSLYRHACYDKNEMNVKIDLRQLFNVDETHDIFSCNIQSGGLVGIDVLHECRVSLKQSELLTYTQSGYWESAYSTGPLHTGFRKSNAGESSAQLGCSPLAETKAAACHPQNCACLACYGVPEHDLGEDTQGPDGEQNAGSPMWMVVKYSLGLLHPRQKHPITPMLPQKLTNLSRSTLQHASGGYQQPPQHLADVAYPHLAE
ncbi:hypothetical protein MAR_007332 [Mya arenaria]|uniref:Uncharacterized protein n=1 Tax=Mya arenaria TaxID=6604 RepID=A0ABY7DB01_MYAAR|nr:hypothetical protein MAR_007332 [Mya arenaria]